MTKRWERFKHRRHQIGFAYDWASIRVSGVAATGEMQVGRIEESNTRGKRVRIAIRLMTWVVTVGIATGCRNQHESTADQNKAQDVEWPKVRVGLPAKHHLQQVTRVVGEPVYVGVPAL